MRTYRPIPLKNLVDNEAGIIVDLEATTALRNYSQPRTGIPRDGFIRYRAALHDCTNCFLKTRCWANTKVTKIMRPKHENGRDVARYSIRQPSINKRARSAKKVETQFAHMNRILKVNRLRLRRLSVASDEFYSPRLHRTRNGWRNAWRLVRPKSPKPFQFDQNKPNESKRKQLMNKKSSMTGDRNSSW